MGYEEISNWLGVVNGNEEYQTSIMVATAAWDEAIEIALIGVGKKNLDNPLILAFQAIGRLLTQLCFYTNACSFRIFLIIAGITSLLLGISTGVSTLSVFGGLSCIFGLIGYFINIRNGR